MATFQARVEDYVGTFSDTGALSDWLTAGARKLVDFIPQERAHEWAINLVYSAGGVSISGKRVISARNGSYGAIKRDENIVGNVVDTSSIWYATLVDPVYIIKEGKIYIYPESGTPSASIITYPTVAFSDSTIANFPNFFEQVVVLYATIQALEQMLNDATDVEEDLEKAQMITFQVNTIKREYERCLSLYLGQFKPEGAKE